MIRPTYIMGNWKANGSKASIDKLLSGLCTIKKNQNQNVIIFPPYVYLEKTDEQIKNSGVKLGAQNISPYGEGAYTGEVTGAMLRDTGCEYVLVGHSERRALFHESNDSIAQKFKQALTAGLCPVLCVGETHTDRLAKKTEAVVLSQLESVLNLKDLGKPWILAYEPVWAIGTGLSAAPDEAQAVHALLRDCIKKYHGADKANALPIVYGGSVKADNAKQLFEMPDIDGALVGGASLNAAEFNAICAWRE